MIVNAILTWVAIAILMVCILSNSLSIMQVVESLITQ